MANVWTEATDKPDRWRVCWRGEWRAKADGTRERPKGSKTVTGAAARDELVVKVRRELDVAGAYTHEGPAEVKVANLELAALAWVRHKAARGSAPSSIQSLTAAWKRISQDGRAVLGIPADQPIPVTVLSRDLVTKLLERWRVKDKLSESTRYGFAIYLLKGWQWMSDDPEAWPGVPVPPRDRTSVLPPAPVLGFAPDAPTVAEMDAICRRAVHSTYPDLREIVMSLRLTGLRIGQVLAMRVRDVDAVHGLLVVATGKSRKEKADQRVVPIHPELLPVLAGRVEGRQPSDLVFAPLKATASARFPPTEHVHALWRAATDAKEVREHVWNPRNRGNARPDHAFRAGFLDALADAGVAEGVRFFLVGHVAETTEARHYARPSNDKLKEGLAKLAHIDWIGPNAPTNVVSITAKA